MMVRRLDNTKGVLQKLMARHGPRVRVAVIPHAGFTLPACEKVAEVSAK